MLGLWYTHWRVCLDSAPVDGGLSGVLAKYYLATVWCADHKHALAWAKQINAEGRDCTIIRLRRRLCFWSATSYPKPAKDKSDA